MHRKLQNVVYTKKKIDGKKKRRGDGQSEASYRVPVVSLW